jgi:hypothetical protein
MQQNAFRESPVNAGFGVMEPRKRIRNLFGVVIVALVTNA